MAQLNLDGKEAINKQKCVECNKYVESLYSGAIYHPFDNKPSLEYDDVCTECEMKLLSNTYFCEECGRNIFYNNGFRINVRTEFIINENKDNEEFYECICVKCCQEKWFENGMNNFKDADFFSYSDLEKNGYERHDTYFCRSEESYKNVESLFNELRKQGYKVIVDIIADGMGFEHHIGLWIRKKGE